MQTFLPYENFVQTAVALDYRRLGKQRVETLQILNTLLGESEGWRNHPAVKMWRGHEFTLVDYGLTICEEWIERGYKDTCRGKIIAIADRHYEYLVTTDVPSWLGMSRLHISHQSNLVRKAPEFYRERWPMLRSDLPYYWPTEDSMVLS